MNAQSADQARLDALWNAYIEADPDLRRLERRKKAIERRRIREAHAKRIRGEAAMAIIHDLIEGARRFVICLLVVAVFMVLLSLA